VRASRFLLNVAPSGQSRSAALSISFKPRLRRVRNSFPVSTVVWTKRKGVHRVSILWIILIIVLVLLLLGFFSRGRW